MSADVAKVQRVVTILDGAMGTLLAERGATMRAPSFSAAALLDAPELVVGIHRDYLLAGAEVISTNSFFTHRHNLRAAGLEARARELTMLSVRLARRARDQLAGEDEGFAAVRIAGSVSPLVGDFRVTDMEAACAEHHATVEALVAGGCDLLLLESMTEATALLPALAAARASGHEMWVSLVPNAFVGDPNVAGSRAGGGDMRSTAAAAVEAGASALLLNCCALSEVDHALTALELATASTPGLSLGLYPHLSAIDASGRWIARAHTSSVFAEHLESWALKHPRIEILGGCCGSTPEDISAITSRVRRWSRRS